MKERHEEVARRNDQKSVAAGHAALGRAARTGEPFSAPTPSAVREVGAQAAAAGRGAWDAVTLGVGDHVVAGIGAVGDALGGGDFNKGYGKRIQEEHALDARDARQYGVARSAGQIAGTVAPILVLGPAEGALLGVRMAETTPLIARELASLGGVGAAVGAGTQVVLDTVNGRRSTGDDVAGAAVGGPVGMAAGNIAARSGDERHRH